MNQILSTNNNNNNYNKTDIRKIIIFFCIAILLVAIILVSIKIVVLIKNNSAKENAVPTIEISRLSEDAKEVTIRVTCPEGISYLIYTWNNEDENRVNLNGSTTFERVVDIPEKELNDLNVNVVSSNGITNEKTELFEIKIDTVKPKIESISILETKIHIKVSDNMGIKYLSYQWEGQDAVIVGADETNNKVMETDIDIQRGIYKLSIKVVDIYDNEETLSRMVTGLNEPVITAIKYDDVVHITVTHDMGFKRIEFIINDRVYVYDDKFSQYDSAKTTVEFDFPLDKGENLVTVNAYSLEKLSEDESDELNNYSLKQYIGRCTYEP